MRELRMSDDQLAQALTELGTRIAWPPVPDTRARVLARISAGPSGGARSGRRATRSRPRS